MKHRWTGGKATRFALGALLTGAVLVGLGSSTEPVSRETGERAPGVLVRTTVWSYRIGDTEFQVAARRDTTHVSRNFTAFSEGRPLPVASIEVAADGHSVVETYALP